MSDLQLLVDNTDTPIGSKHRNELDPGDIYRVAALWLTDAATGDILLAQRKWDKQNDPGKWAAAAAGTVEAHETYESNIAKETEEEIGLTGLAFTPGPKLFVDDGKHRFFCQWFFASVDKNNVTITPQEAEVEAVEWVSKTWLLQDLAAHPDNYTPATPDALRALGIA